MRFRLAKEPHPTVCFVLLEGELRSQPSNPEAPAFVARAPAITGLLPYSRMTHFPATARAVVRTRAAVFPADRFHEMLERPPYCARARCGRWTDGVRRATQLQGQTEKLAALGKISAGLRTNSPTPRRPRGAQGEICGKPSKPFGRPGS